MTISTTIKPINLDRPTSNSEKSSTTAPKRLAKASPLSDLAAQSSPTKTRHMRLSNGFFNYINRHLHSHHGLPHHPRHHYHARNCKKLTSQLHASFAHYNSRMAAQFHDVCENVDKGRLFAIADALATPQNCVDTHMLYTIHDYLNKIVGDHAKSSSSPAIKALIKEYAFSLAFHQLQIGYGHMFDNPSFREKSEAYLEEIYLQLDDQIRKFGAASVLCLGSVDHQMLGDKHCFYLRLSYPESTDHSVLRVEVINSSYHLAPEEDRDPIGTPNGKQWLQVNRAYDLCFKNADTRFEYVKELLQNFQYVPNISLDKGAKEGYYQSLSDLYSHLERDGGRADTPPTHQTPQKGNDCGFEAHCALWRTLLNNGEESSTAEYKALKRNALLDAHQITNHLYDLLDTNEVDPLELEAGRMLEDIDQQLAHRIRA